jgi:hypothetical protein
MGYGFQLEFIPEDAGAGMTVIRSILYRIIVLFKNKAGNNNIPA